MRSNTFHKASGSLAMLAAMRRASSRVSSPAAVRLAGAKELSPARIKGRGLCLKAMFRAPGQDESGYPGMRASVKPAREADREGAFDDHERPIPARARGEAW